MIKYLVFALSLSLFMVQTSSAGDVGDGFTFRRVLAPPKGTLGKRITVQIALGAPTVPQPKEGPKGDPATTPPASPSVDGDWFWSRISPLLPAPTSGRARFLDALDLLAAAPEAVSIGGLRLAHLQKIADQYGTLILSETVNRRVSPALVLAVIAIESAGRAEAVSPAGAAGLMQLMPATAARFGVSDALDPAQSIRGGTAYLDWLLHEFNGDPLLALAAYNAGEGAVQRNMGVPPYAETRAYVPKVLVAWSLARQLCLTPPDLPEDGCVFAARTAAAK